jgi:glucose/arabinose dehydrogenase
MPRSWKARILILAAVAFPCGLILSAAEEPAEPGKKARPATQQSATAFECRWAKGPIQIDGQADEEAWKHAQTIDHFYLPWLGPNARKARTATRAKLLWDREYLYFFAEMEDTDLYTLKETKGETWENDSFGLFFKPAEQWPGYYEFQVNAAGKVLDLFLPRRGSGGARRYQGDTQFHVEAKVKLRGTLNHWQDKDTGWSVEGRIPWKDFFRTGGRPAVDERWKFALCRSDCSVTFEGPELSTCAPLQSLRYPDFHHFEDYASLRFVGPPASDTARPYGVDRRLALTTSRVIGSPEPPPPFRKKKVFPELKINFPIWITRQPGSDRYLFVTEHWPYAPTAIHRMKDDAKVSKFETLLELDGVAYTIVFHPNFAKNGYVYIGWNGPSSGSSSARKSRVTRYTMDRRPPYRLDPKSATEIIAWPSDGHNGAAIVFGHDGMMYITSGDGTSDSDTNIVGQDMSKLVAKLLRIDVDHPEPGKTYAVPKDNPFISLQGARPEIWAYGFRNPWRMTVDAKTGHIWVGQNGQDLWEQAYLVTRGANYGWSVMEGSHPFYPKRKVGPTPILPPTVEHPHSESRSLTGGIVYYGQKFPELRGAYIYGDYSTGKVWAARHDGKRLLWDKEIADTRLQITAFATDGAGEILIADHRGKNQGGFYTLERTPKDTSSAKFPRKLSATGLFRSVKGHVVEPALIPYSVNAPLWGDNAFKQRWIALPGVDSHIDFTTSRGWNFPDQTVIVKSFGLEMEEGNPASRRWIETRLLTRQEGEWFGYSYAWNEQQTEAVLVEAKGLNRDFRIGVPRSKQFPEGVRKQTWHFPSRTECMVCHSRAANWVLGLTELQLNKEHDYGGVRDNQLRTLEHLGVLRVNWADEARTALREELKAKGLSDKAADDYLDKQTGTRNQREAVQSSLLTFPPEKYRKLVDPYDARQDLTQRARSYLHSNCAQCHVEAGGGNAQIDLEFTTKLENMKLVNVRPQHDTFGLPEPRLIAPGHPERSVLLHRVSCRGPGQMPPLATSLVDQPAVEMLREWVRQMQMPKKKSSASSGK